MKYVKMLGLAVSMGAVLAAFVGDSSASATTLTGESGRVLTLGGKVHAVNEGTVVLTTSFKTITCTESTIEGEITQETGTVVVAAVKTLTWGGCNCDVTTLNSGDLTIGVNGTGPNGTLASKNAEITATCETIFGTVHCIYATGALGTTLGTLTGGNTTGGRATADIGSAGIPRLSTSAVCSEKAIWDAKYTVDKPEPLNVIS